MDIIPYNLETWKLNTNYDLVKNCRVVKPPYESAGFYSTEFFLDKRYSIENLLPLINQDGREFLDYIDCNWYRYYYYNFESKTYIWVFDSNGDFQNITPDWFIVNGNSPLRLTKWFWAYWASQSVWNVSTNIYKTIYRWDYDNSYSYAVNDVVTYWSIYYINISESTNQLPTNITYWTPAEDWLPATYTWYTFTFSSNLDDEPSVLTIDWKDILIWEWYYGNEELARDQVLERFREVFPTYIITRSWLKYTFNNSSTPVSIALNTTHNKIKKIDLWWIANFESKIWLTIDWVTSTSDASTHADNAWYRNPTTAYSVWDEVIYYNYLSTTYQQSFAVCQIANTWFDPISNTWTWDEWGYSSQWTKATTLYLDYFETKLSWYKYKRTATWFYIARPVWTYTTTNHIWADVVVSSTTYDRYSYRIWAIDDETNNAQWFPWWENWDAKVWYVKVNAWWTEYKYTYPTWITWTATAFTESDYFNWSAARNNTYELWTVVYWSLLQTATANPWIYTITKSPLYRNHTYAINEYIYYFKKNDMTSMSFSSEIQFIINSANDTYLAASYLKAPESINSLTTATVVSYNWTSSNIWEEQVWFIATIPSYDDWFLSFEYTWIITAETWYLLFTSWALEWLTVKFDYNDAGKLFLLWTNIRWTMPEQWDTFEIFKYVGDNIYVWWQDNLYQVTLDWTLQSPEIINSLTLIDDNFIDVTTFNWSIFAITKDKIYYSNYSTHSNGDFYALNFFNVIGWYRLFNIGKSIIVFAWENKILSPLQIWTKQLFWLYDFNYNWNLFSKYSCLFADQTIMILQDDKQLMEVSIIETAKNTFDLSVKQVTSNVRWIFSNIFWWEVFFDNSDKELIMLNVEADATKDSWYRTTSYVYDKEYEHWKINEYAFKINKFWSEYKDVYNIYRTWIIWIDHLSTLWTTYLDLGVHSYTQEVNMRLWDGERLMMPYIIRTLFWMPNEPLDVTLETSFEIWGKKEVQTKNLTWFEHDLRVTTPEESPDDLLWDDDDWFSYWVIYDWSVVWIQSNIMKTWRFIFFKYHSSNRFIIWKSFVITDKTKTFINELTLTN